MGVVATLVVIAAWSADAAPGDDDATYVPWPGCRLVDTRPASQVGPRGTKLSAEEAMTVAVYGNQGQCTGELAIPNDAVGLATNVTVVDATANSNIRVYRGDLDTPPLLSNLNVVPGGPPTPNKVDTQLAPNGTLKVYNANGAVHVIIDVVGFYSPTSLVQLATTGGPQGPPGPAGPAGVVTMHHGHGPDTSSPDDPVLFVVPKHSETRVEINADDYGEAFKELHAPRSIAGVDYALTSVQYCFESFGFAFLSSRAVYATPDDSVPVGGSPPVAEELAADQTDVESGCQVLEVNDDEPRRAVTVMFGIDGGDPFDGVPQGVDFRGLTSTWTPID